MGDQTENLEQYAKDAQALTQSLLSMGKKWFYGDSRVLFFMLSARLVKGHVLLSGPPGVAKTTLAQGFGTWLGLVPTRVQFSPDMLPMDITGGYTIDPSTGKLVMKKGPVFNSFVVADEVNRAPGRAHATLLEAMEERRVSVEGESHGLPHDFFMVATQNPKEASGTFMLPDALLDRFTLNIEVPYPSEDYERELYLDGVHPAPRVPVEGGALSQGNLDTLCAAVPHVFVSQELAEYALQTIRAFRASDGIEHGPSPRAGLSWLQCARAVALQNGRTFVTPEDLQETSASCLLHRVLGKRSRSPQQQPAEILKSLFTQIPFLGGVEK